LELFGKGTDLASEGCSGSKRDPAGAKAKIINDVLYGTAEAVPLQEVEFAIERDRQWASAVGAK
jgi:hypothetical protein